MTDPTTWLISVDSNTNIVEVIVYAHRERHYRDTQKLKTLDNDLQQKIIRLNIQNTLTSVHF